MQEETILVRLGLLALTYAATVAALDAAGVAGYRRGALVVALPLVAGAALATAWALRIRSPRNLHRWPWTLVVAVVGLLVTATLDSRAPYSREVLKAQLDAIELPFFEVISERQSGRSWCRPACPAIERRYDVPDVGVQATMLTFGVALEQAGILTGADLRRIGTDPQLTASSDRQTITIRIDEGDDGAVERATIRIVARRP